MSPAARSPILVVGAAILRDGLCFVVRRSATMRWPGKWEFPGGKLEPGESPSAALVREIREELAMTIAVDEHLGRGADVTADGRVVQLDVYAARWTAGTIVLREHDAAQWCDAEGLSKLEWPNADIPIVPRVVARLGKDR